MKYKINQKIFMYQKSVMEIVKDFMRQKVGAFNDGKDIFELYASFMFYVTFLGGGVLMLVGALLDSFIVYSIVYSITHTTWLSIGTAGVLCFLIQVFLGTSVVLTSVSLLNSKFKTKGYRTLTLFTASLVAISLFSTLFLSYHSSTLVGVVKTTPTLLSVDTSSVERRIAEININTSMSIATLERTRGEWVRSYDARIAGSPKDATWLQHLKAKEVAKIDTRIEKLHGEARAAIALVRTQEIAEKDRIGYANTTTLSQHDHTVSYWGGVVRYSNVLINLLRTFLLIILVKWVLAVKQQQHQGAMQARPGIIPVGNTLPFREAEKQFHETVSPVIHASDEDTPAPTETVLETVLDISGLKNKARVYYGRIATSKSEKAKKHNKQTFQNLKSTLEKHGFEIIEQGTELLIK